MASSFSFQSVYSKELIDDKKALRTGEMSLKNVKERKINCLIVNDDDFSLLIIKLLLKSLNYIGRVDQAANGQEAYDFVKKAELDSEIDAYDVIFLDLNMPIMNGYDACTKIIEFFDSS